MVRILIKNGRIWDGEKFFFADILTEDKLIARIGENITDNADFVFDAKGKTVSSGLVDIHVHMKNVSCDKYGTDAHMSSFPFGVTAANDAGGGLGNKAFLDSLAVKNTVFVGVDIVNNHAEFDRAETNLKKYGDRAIGLKVYFDVNVSAVDDITPLKEVCEYARNRGLRVMVHCSNSPVPMVDIVNTLSAGDILTHIFHGGENSCTENGYEALKIAKQKGVILDSGFAGYVHTDFENMKRALSAGFLPDTISTDITCLSAYIRGGRYGMTMCMSIARKSGMREEDIFRAVTATPASALGKGGEWGCLKVGKTADIALFDYADEGFALTDEAGNTIQSDVGYRCVLTIADGQILYRL